MIEKKSETKKKLQKEILSIYMFYFDLLFFSIA